MTDEIDTYTKGKFKLEEWEDVNYCEHYFFNGDEPLNDKEVVDLLNELSDKPFLKIIDNYYIKLVDEGEVFDLHKPSDIRSLIYLINRKNGFSELQCEYNDVEMI